MEKKRKSSKGLSLIELIVAVAISSMIMLVVTNIISSSLKNYTRETSQAQAQNENQLTMSAVTDIIMEAKIFKKSDVVTADGADVWIETSLTNDMGDTFTDTVGKSLYYDSKAQKLYLSKLPWSAISADPKAYMLAENVVDFKVEFDDAMSLYTVTETKIENKVEISQTKTYLKEHPTFKVTLVVETNNREVEYTRSVVLRNAMASITVDGTTYNAKQ